ncbi:protein of unknown function [Moritella yayanosii]|uniref:DUF4113 domain-containing protein n=1 Tax=Moritella yayanosii TaxID=69539 RepID=A0A330LWE2_9GAMM|nr:protein of unknown function [Moritella yayanosii]
MAVFDVLNQKYGRDTLFLGAQGIDKKWAMRRNMLTPQYTTKWLDLPKVRCCSAVNTTRLVKKHHRDGLQQTLS